MDKARLASSLHRILEPPPGSALQDTCNCPSEHDNAPYFTALDVNS